MEGFKIDKEFQELIPALQPNELRELEASLKAEGCREPLMVWRGILIDGHNRYSICRKENISFKTREVDLPSRDHALLWIETNQLARRNLTDDQRTTIALSILERRSAMAKRERASKAGRIGGNGRPKPTTTERQNNLSDTLSDKLKPKTDTRAEVAKEVKVPERKLRDLAEVKKKAPEAIVRIRRGETTIREEKSRIRRGENIQRIAEDSKSETPLDGSIGRFPVIYADPPWEYDYEPVDAWANDNHYKPMSLEAICRLPVQQISTKDAILFLWTTAPKLEEAFKVINSWGFSYITSAVWNKCWTGRGYYFRIQHEHLLIAKRGKIPVPEEAARPGSIIEEKRTKHSKKPDIFYEIIEKMYPELPKIELFARNEREGWDSWGNQLKKEEVI